MAMDAKIVGKTGLQQDVDAAGFALVKTSTDPVSVGATRLYTENDAGDHTTVPFLMQPETSPDYKLRCGLDTLLFNDSFNTTAENTSIWRNVFVIMTTTESGGSLLFNANSNMAAANGYAISSFRYIPVIQTVPTYLEFSGYPTAVPLAGQIFEFGLFAPTTGIVAPVDGAFFRHSNAGLFGVLNFNGVETALDLTAALAAGSQASFLISIGQNQVRFWLGGFGLGDVLLGTIETPAAQGSPFMSMALPIGMQFRNSGTVTGGPVMQWKMCNVSAWLADAHTSKPWPHQMAGMGGHCSQVQNGATPGGTALMSSAAPSAAGALVQASAAAQFQGLGGLFRVLPTLTVGTGGLVDSFTNPIGTVNQTGKTLYITSVKIQAAVEVILAGGPLLNHYAIAYGQTADSLATAETASFATASTKKPRYVPLGFDSFAANAVAGTLGTPIERRFDSPIVVNPGERIGIECRNMGVVTTTGNTLVSISYDGYWE